MHFMQMTVPAVNVAIPYEVAEFCGWISPLGDGRHDWVGPRRNGLEQAKALNPAHSEAVVCAAFLTGVPSRRYSPATIKAMVPRREAAIFVEDLSSKVTAAANTPGARPDAMTLAKLRQGVFNLRAALRVSLIECPDHTVFVRG